MNPTKVSQFDPNLVLWLRMQEGPNPVAFDYSGASNHGIIYGATWSSPGLYFDGVNDYVDAGNAASLQITTAITLEAWVYHFSSAFNQFAIVYGSNGFYDYGIIWQATTERMMFSLKIDGVWGDRAYSATIPDNTWVYIVGTYDGSRAKIYRNGILDDDEPLTGSITITGGNSFRVGYAAAINHWWNGSIDDVRIYNRALSAGEINSVFQSTRSKYGV